MTSERAGTAAEEAYEAGSFELAAAGDAAVGEFRCVECGYGVIVHRELPPCPMCGGASWKQTPWSPFSRASPRGLPH
jgi:rubrerythrin